MKATFNYRKSRGQIERVDRRGQANHFIRKQMIDKAKRNVDKEDKYNTTTKPETVATDQATQVSKEAAYQSYKAPKGFLQKRSPFLLRKDIKDDLNSKGNNQSSNSKIYNFNHTKINNNSSSNSSMKQYVINKTKVDPKSLNKQYFTKAKDAVMSTVENITKKALSSNNQLIIAGAICLIVVSSMLFGAISTLASDSSIIPAQQILSDEVLAYEDTIIKYAKESGIEDYVMIIEAIMMQESKGIGNDPMQATNCPLNTKYPDGITDPDYSIKIGIEFYADCLRKSNAEDVNDDKGIALSLQGYNYGTDYISWALSNFNGYTKANAKVYSDMKKSQLQVDTYGDPNYVEHVLRYVSFGFGNLRSEPNFNNLEAWVTKNPYAQAGLYGQCTWFAWGRFYEIYGYSPGFTGNGWDCVNQLIATHPDKFKKSSTPIAGAIFSTLGHNHVGIVITFDGTNITIQDGNYDGKTNTFSDAKKDWRTQTMPLSNFISINGGVVFANPM